MYLISYFGQKIILDNPMVQFALRYIDGGEEVREIVTQTDYDGALISTACIASCFGLLAFNKYKTYNSLKSKEHNNNQLGSS
jgi:UDP-N-acetylmuramyl pentapeptide phosphotransferase/UDP-N-acetylglucosamine-1-phosphate transferase